MQGHSGGNKYCLILNRPLIGTPKFCFQIIPHIIRPYLLVLRNIGTFYSLNGGFK